ncbi:MAG: hypothetical protein RLZZ188_1157 [Verrucomicrobiota bacterium]|jgi:capsular polysaccharide biosynthesis protein
MPVRIVLRFLKPLFPESLKRRCREFYWPPWCLPLLPGTSARFGPARRWVSVAEYRRDYALDYREVLPAQKIPAPDLTECAPVPRRFFSSLFSEVPPAGILQLQQARLLGPDGWVIGADDSHLVQASYWAYPDATLNIRDHYQLRRRRAPPRRHLPGRTLSLASDFAVGGFGHFVHDSATRLLIVESAGIDPASFDWIYWPHVESPVAEEIIRRSGLPRAKIVHHLEHKDFVCDSLTVTTFPGRPGHIAPVYANYLRQRFAPPASGKARRIYLSRAGFRRNFRNATDIDLLLAARGFEACSPHADVDLLAKCAAAEQVVAIEGANFFNVFSCAPGTKVLLILPDSAHTRPFTITLALSAGLRLYVLPARSLDQPAVDPGIADIHVDPAALRRALDLMDAA